MQVVKEVGQSLKVRKGGGANVELVKGQGSLIKLNRAYRCFNSMQLRALIQKFFSQFEVSR